MTTPTSVQALPTMADAGTSDACSTISSPNCQRYDAIAPSASLDAVPLTWNATPTVAAYGPPGRATGAVFDDGGGVVGGGSDGVSPDGTHGVAEGLVASYNLPRSAPGTMPPSPAA